ncbi:peptidase [Mycolicibacterium confluentis]|uniref:Peptidase n=1 Tax=Mycolicibacterium confluentis TaxID=28047 RepID=A0A7I7XUK3_9MYCO|nr:peptidase [Mycolicibacterium confluentis]
MRMPRAAADFNRRVTNPVARSLTPWLPCLGTLEHTGRTSGKHYRTPLLVFGTRDGFVILIGYGPETDWLKNVLAGGPTVLTSGAGRPRWPTRGSSARLRPLP